VIIFVLAAILTVSALGDGTNRKKVALEKFINGQYDTLIEFAEQLLLGVNKLFAEAVNEVAYGIRTLFEALDEFKDFGIQFAETAVDKEMEIINAVIEKYKNETSEESQAIWECLQSIESEVVLARDEAINTSLSCIDSEIQIVGDGIMQILLDMKNLNEDLKQEEKTLETCKNETTPVACIQNVIDKLGEIVVTLTTTIVTDADKAQTDFDNLGPKIEQCVNASTAALEKENDRIFNEFSQCVYEKQQSSTSAP
jgi:ElaB/YqjD/DUF883 family membrane-anchored ribosome-binding protein